VREECTSTKGFFDCLLLTLNTDARNNFKDIYILIMNEFCINKCYLTLELFLKLVLINKLLYKKDKQMTIIF
jgi:hypothetical protein